MSVTTRSGLACGLTGGNGTGIFLDYDNRSEQADIIAVDSKKTK